MLGSLLRELREKRGLTQEALGERLGLSQTHVYRFESDKSRPTVSTLKKVARVLHADYEKLREQRDLAEEEFEKQKAIAKIKAISTEGHLGLSSGVSTRVFCAGHRIPILNDIPTDVPEDFTDYDFPPGVAEEYVDDYLQNFTTTDLSTYALRVRGNCMTPKLEKGDIVLLSSTKEWKNGDIVAVRWGNGNKKELRRIIKQGDHIILKPENPEYNPIVLGEEDKPEVMGVFVMMVRVAK